MEKLTIGPSGSVARSTLQLGWTLALMAIYAAQDAASPSWLLASRVMWAVLFLTWLASFVYTNYSHRRARASVLETPPESLEAVEFVAITSRWQYVFPVIVMACLAVQLGFALRHTGDLVTRCLDWAVVTLCGAGIYLTSNSSVQFTPRGMERRTPPFCAMHQSYEKIESVRIDGKAVLLISRKCLPAQRLRSSTIDADTLAAIFQERAGLPRNAAAAPRAKPV